MTDPLDPKIRKATNRTARVVETEERVPKRQINLTVNSDNYDKLLNLLPRGSFSRTVDKFIEYMLEELKD